MSRTLDNSIRARRSRVKCPACGGHGGEQVIRHWGRGYYDCYPDYEECGACEGRGRVSRSEAAHIEALIEDDYRYVMALEEAEERAEAMADGSKFRDEEDQVRGEVW